MSFAIYCYADLGTIALTTSVGLVGWSFYVALADAGVLRDRRPTPTGALVVGFCATIIVRTTNAPGFGMESGGLLPLVPGLTLLNGLLRMVGQGSDNPAIVAGGKTLFVGILVALGIAAGATLGTYLGRPVNEQVRRLRRRVKAAGRIVVRPDRRLPRGPGPRSPQGPRDAMTGVSDTTPRPSQTTMAAGMVIAGSVLVVVTVGEQLATINSLETRRVVEQFLAEHARHRARRLAGAAGAAYRPDGGGRVRHRGGRARLPRPPAQPPGPARALGAGAAAVLRRARDRRLPDLAGGRRDGAAVARPLARVVRRHTDPGAGPPRSPRAAAAGLAVGSAPARHRPAATCRRRTRGPSAQPRRPWSRTWPPQPSAPARRPDAVVWACVLTWAFSAITVAVLGASLTLLLADASLVWAELDRQNPGLVAQSGLTRDDLMPDDVRHPRGGGRLGAGRDRPGRAGLAPALRPAGSA